MNMKITFFRKYYPSALVHLYLSMIVDEKEDSNFEISSVKDIC